MSKEKIHASKLAKSQGDLATPVPGDKHVFCGVCNENYICYKKHIASSLHQQSIDSCNLYD